MIIDQENITIGVIGSHSALDVCRGAKSQGFKTLVVAQRGREKTYSQYYKSSGDLGCVDEVILLDKFADILKLGTQKQLIERNTVFVPHRSFEVYLNFDYKAIDEDFNVPIFGNKFLLKSEERGVSPNQYDLLEEANIRYPLQFDNPKDIDRLCLVKVLEEERGFERAFFLVKDYSEYKQLTSKFLKEGTFTEKQLANQVIEEFVMGVHVNFNFFYSPISDRLELMGTDARRQTNLEGMMRIPSKYQSDVLEKVEIKYEEAGHYAVTVLESMLESAFEQGQRFVEATKKLFKPGVIGPFALQSIITPGPPKKEIVVIDVSPRMPGSPGTSSTPYTNYLFGRNISVGERLSMEVKEAVAQDSLELVVT